MMRSFQYAAYAALWQQAMRKEDMPFLERWADLWYRRRAAFFLQSYLNMTTGAMFVPKNSDDSRSCWKPICSTKPFTKSVTN